MNRPVLRILGTRGVPAAHGGFETFAEHLALFLVARGWQVWVYCQDEGEGPWLQDQWQGVDRIRIPVVGDGPKSTIVFDWKATRHAAAAGDLCLTLGYNTALFCGLLRMGGVPNVINMDGIEWSRAKWGALAKTWFWMNDWAGCWLGNHLVADHPEIKNHLSTRVSPSKVTTIAYGAERISSAGEQHLKGYGLESGRYLTVIARAEPENSLLEVVSGFSEKPRGFKLVVLGNYSDKNPYHQRVRAAASEEVRFLGAIYDKTIVQSLRFHSFAYVHGHQVGGTNPSLVEALGAGNAVLAHDNKFNRWVAGDSALFFKDSAGFSSLLDLLEKSPSRVESMRSAAINRFDHEFTWEKILSQYEQLLRGFLPAKNLRQS